MKNFFMAMLTLTLTLTGTLNIMAQEHDCEVTIPADAIIMEKGGTIINSNQSYVIGVNAEVTVNGSNNFIIMRKGSTATIPGSNNELYVSSGCTVDVPGSHNTIYAAKDSSVSTLGSFNSIKRCKNLVVLGGQGSTMASTSGRKSKKDDLGIGDAVKVLSDLGAKVKKHTKPGKKQGKEEKVIVEATADPSNNLIGTWDVISASALGQEFSVSGKIILNNKGLGYQNYEVVILGEKYPQIGLFKWRSDDSTVYVNENEDFASVWKRLVNKQSFQKVEVKLGEGVKAQLSLSRKK
jgi:hypothetical protein